MAPRVPLIKRTTAEHLLLASLLLLFPALAVKAEVEGPGSQWVASLIWLAVTLCVLRLARSRLERVLAWALLLTSLVSAALHTGSLLAFGTIDSIERIVIIAFVFKVLLGRVWRRRRVSAGAVSSTLSLYLLIGMGWTNLYALVLEYDPRSFTSAATREAALPYAIEDEGGADAPPGVELDSVTLSPMLVSSGLMYFSFVTLTTLGYGDITPVSPVSMALATLEAIVGQLFLVVFVARAVALSVSVDAGNGGRPPPDD